VDIGPLTRLPVLCEARAGHGTSGLQRQVFRVRSKQYQGCHPVRQKLSGVKSPSDFIELSTDHSRKQFETLTEQTKELAALAQKVTFATVEPLKTGVTKAFGQPT
jgi:hypothetical protein